MVFKHFIKIRMFSNIFNKNCKVFKHFNVTWKVFVNFNRNCTVLNLFNENLKFSSISIEIEWFRNILKQFEEQLWIISTQIPILFHKIFNPWWSLYKFKEINIDRLKIAKILSAKLLEKSSQLFSFCLWSLEAI